MKYLVFPQNSNALDVICQLAVTAWFIFLIVYAFAYIIQMFKNPDKIETFESRGDSAYEQARHKFNGEA